MQSHIRKVMLIDDTMDYRHLFTQALKGKNVEVIAFDSGLSAIEYLKTSPALPELVFADYKMPEMSGEEFLDAVRRDSRLTKLKVILSSALIDLPRIAKKLGADGYLTKPFDLSELYRLVSMA